MKHAFITAVLLFTLVSAQGQANTKLSNLVAPTAVNQHLLPNSTNTKDLGSTTLGWRNLYLKENLHMQGSLYMDLDLFMHNKGTGNVFLGNYAGNAITFGTYNTGVGYFAINSNTTGNYNVAIGSEALSNNTTGLGNTATGYWTLYSNTTGIRNTAIGDLALFSNISGNSNTAMGAKALYSNTNGYNNIANGYYALFSNTSGYNNTAIGTNALYVNIAGDYNTANGFQALYNSAGDYNTANGVNALYSNTTGYRNAAHGAYALYSNTGGYYNTALGYNADVTAGNFFNATSIGYNAKVDASNKVRIGNTLVTSIGGQVGWTVFSDGRYKRNIKQDVQGLAFINSLNPVTYTVDVKGLNAYHNKGSKEPTGDLNVKVAAEIEKSEEAASKIIYSGFIAQDVEKAAKNLNYSFSGVDMPQSKDGLYGLRYSDFVAPLVKAVQELSKKTDEIEALKTRIAKLEALLGNGNLSSNTSAAYLEQNNPNPYNGITNIRYHIPATVSSARIQLSNMKGQVVKTYALSKREGGQLTINSTTLAAGTYTCTLYVDGKRADSKQLILAK